MPEQSTPEPSQTEQATIAALATVAQFENKRRLVVARTIGLAFAGLLTALTLAFFVFEIQGAFGALSISSVAITLSALLICIMGYGVGALAAQNDQLRLATVSTILATNFSIILMVIFWDFLLGRGFSPVLFILFAATTVPIVLAGDLGGMIGIMLSTLGMNGLVIVLVIFSIKESPLQTQFFENERVLFTLLALAIQWAVATITLTSARNDQRTMRALSDAYVQVQRLDNLKDQFITNVNHELRTPVMTLQSYVEYLRLTRQDLSPEEEEEVFTRASRAGYNLVTLLTSILDVRRIDQRADDFTPTAVPLFDALQNALLLLDPRERGLGEHELQIRIANSLAVWGEEVRLQQILINLISNAIKYSDPGTAIEISAQYRQSPTSRWSQRFKQPTAKRHMVEIIIQDHGFGIPPDQIPLLFNRFARLPRDLASNIVGNGLGLFLCRTLARAMGGEIQVESQGIPGEGSKFIVTLPVPPTEEFQDFRNSTEPRLKVVAMPPRESSEKP